MKETILKVALNAHSVKRIENGFSFKLATICGKFTLIPHLEVYKRQLIFTCTHNLAFDGQSWFYGNSRSMDSSDHELLAYLWKALESKIDIERTDTKQTIKHVMENLTVH